MFATKCSKPKNKHEKKKDAQMQFVYDPRIYLHKKVSGGSPNAATEITIPDLESASKNLSDEHLIFKFGPFPSR